MGSGKNKIVNRINYTTLGCYGLFKEKYKDSTITNKQFKSIIIDSNHAISEHILSNELGFKLPMNMGYIAVDKYKQPAHYRVIDWANSNKFGRDIPLTNFHSFGHMYKIKLFRNQSLKYMLYVTMSPHRIVKRALAKRLKEGVDVFLNLEAAFFNKRFSITKIFKCDK